MQVTLIHPTSFKLDGGAMFGIIPKPLWSKKIIPDELNRIQMSLRVVLIQTKNKNILIDTGIGDYHPEKFNQQFAINESSSPLENILQKELGISPKDITDIILTHLHFDHVGGLGIGNEGTTPLFPKAKLHLHKDHLTYAQNPTIRDSGSFQSEYFLPLINYYKEKNKLNLLTEEMGEILIDNGEQINYKTSQGHTPFMIHPIFDNYIYMADLVPMSHHINLPWVMGYDIEPGLTTVYKKNFYDGIIEEGFTMIFEHDEEIWGGDLEINERGQYSLQKSYPSTQAKAEVIRR